MDEPHISPGGLRVALYGLAFTVLAITVGLYFICRSGL
jgi:hypothetical protein